jgi:hypothetical protein
MSQFRQLPSAQVETTASRVRNMSTKSDNTHTRISIFFFFF